MQSSRIMKIESQLSDSREMDRLSRVPTLPEIDAAGASTVACVSRILVPTDFTEAADDALSYATSLATQLGASVVVCHVYQLPTALAGAELSTRPTIESTAEIDRAARIGVQEAIAKQLGARIPMAAIIRPGNPETEILTIAREVSADLIILGSHGRSGLMRVLVGSVTDDLVHHAEIPVLVLHGKVARES